MNNNRIIAAVAALVLGAVSLGAQAGNRNAQGHGHDRHDHGDRQARVVQVEPIYERVRHSVPVEHCWNERERHVHGADRNGAAIAGGVLGAVIGNRVGDGRGVATVAGAVAGALIGSEIGRDGREVRYRDVRRCEVRRETRVEERVVAYRVTYVHRGRRDVTRLAYNPGRYIDVADIRRRG
ncbi:MAG TPA: glycine zipper 2TM domain-containing protein [Steroidobacteraceae bacterium]|nr:glycine zipper 2TM domain-containing protein [Steroidobacteraceae bacterium]